MNDGMITLLENSEVSLDINSNSTYECENRIVPRVTEIISKCIHSDSLMYWANSLGFKHQSYKKTLQKYADIGTECHETIDLFIENNSSMETPEMSYAESRYAYESYLKWWNDINLYCTSVKVIYHEYKLVCKYFGGTMDGLYEINGELFIIDYKTSNHVTFRYLLQIAAYRYILRTVYGIEVNGCIILQLSKNDISYNEYVLNFANSDHLEYINECERTFLSMVYTYYNTSKLEEDFNNIKWGY